MDSTLGFVKKTAQLDAFDDVSKTLPSYFEFLVHNIGYSELTLWQRKKMQNLGHNILVILTTALLRPRSAQVILFKYALKCVKVLIHFHMIS